MKFPRPFQIVTSVILAAFAAGPVLAAPTDVGAAAVRSLADPPDETVSAVDSSAVPVAPRAVASTTSPRLGPTTYAVRKGGVSLVIDGYVASLRDEEAYVPIQIALGQAGAGRAIHLGVESFTLTDHNGNPVPLAGFRAVQHDYDKRIADDTVLRTHPMMLDSRFDALDRIDSRFFPAPGGRGTRVTRVELVPGTWMQDVLYFPRPPSGTHGIMTLTIQAKGLEVPIAVKFRVHPPSVGEQLEG